VQGLRGRLSAFTTKTMSLTSLASYGLVFSFSSTRKILAPSGQKKEKIPSTMLRDRCCSAPDAVFVAKQQVPTSSKSGLRKHRDVELRHSCNVVLVPHLLSALTDMGTRHLTRSGQPGYLSSLTLQGGVVDKFVVIGHVVVTHIF